MNLRSIIYTIIGVLFFNESTSLKPCESDDEFIAAQIILFYSPLDSELIQGQIGIYWNINSFIKGDILNLYYGNPKLDEIQPIFSYQPTKLKGIVKTKVKPSKTNYYANLKFTDQCTGYYGAWIRNTTVRKINCLSTHPNWMSKYRNILENMTLSQLFIPGTHDSGSYSEQLSQSIIQRYTVTQSSSVLDQLISGVRYLDLRPCIIENKYWICHGRYYIQPLENIVNDIKCFMTQTQEIVIVIFKEFSQGFDDVEDHKQFMAYLTYHFEDFLATRPKTFMRDVTLRDLWESKKRLIFSYTLDGNLTPLSFWPEIIQEWGDLKTIESLEHFIATRNVINSKLFMKNHTIFLRAMMAEITLDPMDIIVDSALYYFGRDRKSLRQLGVEIGEKLLSWYNEKYFPLTNIVAVDFVDATGIVETAIFWNLQRTHECFLRF